MKHIIQLTNTQHTMTKSDWNFHI